MSTLLSDNPARVDLSSLRLLRVPETAPPFDGETPPPDTALRTVACVPARPKELRPSAPLREPAACGDWTGRFAQLLVESLAGARPVRQLQPWLSGNAPMHLRRIMPLFGCGQRPRVLRVLASQPVEGVVEMSVIVGLGPRTRALAARLEQIANPGHPPRWLCTAIESA